MTPICSFVGVCIFLILYNYWEINRLVVGQRVVYMDESLQGLKLVHLSDVHVYGRTRWYKGMLKMVSELKPDIICITGDIVDRRIYKPADVLVVIKGLLEIAPVFFVPGNHEFSSGKWDSLKEKLLELGVQMPQNCCIKWEWNGQSLDICGLNDRTFYDTEHAMADAAKNLSIGQNPKKTILLTHRPERYLLYKTGGFGLVLAGHIHGGIIGLPGGRGLVQNINGVIPALVRPGIWGEDPTMIISRGIGNTSIAPVRMFNPPEIVLVVFDATKKQ